MAVNFGPYKPIAGRTDYVKKYDDFITVLQGYAQELEDAAEGETDLQTNLANNYIGYVLANNIDGDTETYKCVNMLVGSDDQDYITVAQANSIGGTAPTNITDVAVGALNANDILVVNAAGNAITGRPCSYTDCPTSGTVLANKNYDMNLTVSKSVTLPSGASEGTTISFADIQGKLTSSITLDITPNASEYMMGLAVGQGITFDAYPHCSFDLVASGITGFGWTLARLQM